MKYTHCNLNQIQSQFPLNLKRFVEVRLEKTVHLLGRLMTWFCVQWIQIENYTKTLCQSWSTRWFGGPHIFSSGTAPFRNIPGGNDTTIRLQWNLKQFIEQGCDVSVSVGERLTDFSRSCKGIIQYFFDNFSGVIHVCKLFHSLLFSLISIWWTTMQHISLFYLGKKETVPEVNLVIQGRICFTWFSQVRS